MSDTEELKELIVEALDEYLSPWPTEIAGKWDGGKLILQPEGDAQPKEVPIEVFFKKMTGVREALRVLEQKINNHDGLSSEDKAGLQAYITKCYGSMTTFNVLFKHDKDKFVGAGKGSKSASSKTSKKLSMSEAKNRLGMNEYGE